MTTKYVLPDLPFDYSALEPHVNARIMELHHDKHHATYVKTANEALEKLLEARHKRDFSQVPALERKLAFNISGHILHSIFWQNLKPKGGARPEGRLLQDLERDFGSFDLFKEQMNQIAATVMGSGWAALVFDPVSRRLGTTQILDHQGEVTQAGVPLLVIDAWEHAYYLQYQNEKAKFFEALWNVWNWQDVARRYELAQKLDLGLSDVAEGIPAVH